MAKKITFLLRFLEKGPGGSNRIRMRKNSSWFLTLLILTSLGIHLLTIGNSTILVMIRLISYLLFTETQVR